MEVMRISANYTVFYGADYIEYSLRSVYPFVDYILIALGKESWAVGADGKRYKPIDNVKEKIRHFMKEEDIDHKIIFFEGMWSSDTAQRNFLIERCNGLVDYALLVDSDEIWDADQLGALIKDVEDNPDTLVFSVGIKQYFRSLFWRFDDSGGRVNYVFKVPEVRHKWIRAGELADVRSNDELVGRRVPVWYHHFGYAFPSKLIKQKITFWGHCGEVVPNWFDEIFMKWRPGKGLPAMAPTGQDWSKLEKCKLIKSLRGHPFAKKELIE